MFIQVTHAHTLNKAYIVKTKIFGIMYSDEQKCACLVSDAGAVFPISESVDFIKTSLKEKKSVRKRKDANVHQRKVGKKQKR